MNKIIALILALLVAGLSSKASARDGLQQFYHQHHADKNVEQITLPKLLLLFWGDDPETRRMLRHMKSLKIFQMEGLQDNREAIAGELSGALKKDGFENILAVTDNGERINIYINQSRKFIHKVLITVDSKDELIVLQIKTKISFDKLSALMNDYKTGKNKSGLKQILHKKGA